jgi:Zn-dependent peptidase ImmA (M78 family)/transcriptional regulator with XRE-family HTH domain
LQVARSFHGLTLGALGEKIGTTHSAIANYESGARQPGPDVLAALASKLGFEPAFFFSPLDAAFNDELYNFRKRQSTPIYMRNAAIAHVILLASLLAFFNELLELPAPSIPAFPVTGADEVERNLQIEHAAEKCRTLWSLRDRPVSSFTDVVENAGAIVTRFAMPLDEEGHVDAFSHGGDRAILVVNAAKGGSRTLFDIAHELGHLVLHGGMVSGTKELEAEADRFASAFLLPRTAMFREFPRPVSDRIDWEALLAFKRRWRASLQATIRRARDLALIDPAIYLKACKSISFRGWRLAEPCEPEIELPSVLPQCFETLDMEYGQKPVDIARQLHWHPSVMQQVVGHDVNPASWNPSSEHDVALWSPATSLRIEAKAPTAMAPPAVTERGGKLLFLRPTQHGRQA